MLSVHWISFLESMKQRAWKPKTQSIFIWFQTNIRFLGTVRFHSHDNLIFRWNLGLRWARTAHNRQAHICVCALDWMLNVFHTQYCRRNRTLAVQRQNDNEFNLLGTFHSFLDSRIIEFNGDRCGWLTKQCSVESNWIPRIYDAATPCIHAMRVWVWANGIEKFRCGKVLFGAKK